MMSSTMMGGFGDLFSAAVIISFARDVSAMSGDQLKLNDMVAVRVMPMLGCDGRKQRSGSRYLPVQAVCIACIIERTSGWTTPR